MPSQVQIPLHRKHEPTSKFQPAQSYADLIALKYQRQEEEEGL